MSTDDAPAEGGGPPRRRRRRATAAQGAPPRPETAPSPEPSGSHGAEPPVRAEAAPPAPSEKARKPRKPRTANKQNQQNRQSTSPQQTTPPAPPPARETADAARRRRPPRDAGERGMRDLAGAGPSQVGVSGALRARDVNRPTDDDLAEAERDVVVVRRTWDQAPPNRSAARRS